MAAPVEVGLSVDADGAVSGTKKAQGAMEDLDDVLDDVAASGEATSQTFDDVQESALSASKGMEGLESEAEGGARSMDQLRGSAEQGARSMDELGAESMDAAADVDRSMKGMASSSEVAESSLRDLSQAQTRARGTTGSLGSSASSTAAQLSVDLTQSAQDAAFGIENLAASAPFLTEQFTRLQSQTGGTTGALSALFSALKGPTGVIAAFTLLLTFKDQIIGFFTDAGDSAEEAAGKVDRLKSAAEELITVDLGLETRDIESLDEARRLVEEMDAEIAEIESLQALSEDLPDLSDELNAGVALEQIGSVRTLLADTELTIEDLKAAAEGRNEPLKAMVELVQDELDGRGKALDNLRTQRDTLEASITEAETLRSVYDRLPDDLKEGNEELQEFDRRTVEAAKALKRISLPAGSPLEGPIGPEGGPSVPGISTEDFRLQTIEEVEGTIKGLEQSLQTMDLSSKVEEQTRRVVDSLKRMKEEMMLARGEAIDLGPAIERGLADSIATAAQAIGEGESVAKAVLNTLASLAQRVGQMMIAFGTASLGLRSLITNPFAAIGAGAALVALGAAAKNAISSEVDAATSGAPTPSRRDGNLEGGGRMTGTLNVPGRRTGGAVEEGQLYQTHGLGDREYFMPATDGAIVTEGAMKAATESASSRRRVDVRTDNRMSIDVNEPDLFELRTRLNEVENEISQLT